MEKSFSMETGFSRTLSNQAKMGAYYTDVSHCEAISRFLKFPDQQDTLILEPAIGDGIAVKTAVNKEAGDGKHIFGVDINRKTVEEVSMDKMIEKVLCADFTNGVNISKNCFSLIFSNPPYMVQNGIRMEDMFLQKFTPCLKNNGILIYVIPYYVFMEKSFYRKLYNRYDIRHVYRFSRNEYKKWHQVVIIAVKRKNKLNISKAEQDEVMKAYLIEEDVPELILDYAGVAIEVPAVDPVSLKTFTTVEFPVEDCIHSMRSGLAKENMQIFHKAVGPRMEIPEYEGYEIGRPPIHPNKDSMYLLGVCGAGSGLCGNEEDGNLHLQRGVVKVVETMEHQMQEGADEESNGIIVATSRAQISYNIIQSDGTITNLE